MKIIFDETLLKATLRTRRKEARIERHYPGDRWHFISGRKLPLLIEIRVEFATWLAERRRKKAETSDWTPIERLPEARLLDQSKE